VQGPFIKSK
jgi:hypothetical protein